MDAGKLVWIALPQDKSILVTQVQTLYPIGGFWLVVEIHKTFVNGSETWKPHLKVKEHQMFQTENEALTAAAKMRPTGGSNKGGHQ